MKLLMEIHVNDLSFVNNKNTPKYNTKDKDGGQQKDENVDKEWQNSNKQ